MSDRVQVNLRVSESQKEKWDRYVEESDEYNNLSDMIRTAVARDMAADGPTRGATPGGSETDERVGELLTVMENMQGRLEDLEETVEAATDAMHTSGAHFEGERSFTAAVFDALPEGAQSAVRAADLANDLGVEKSEVRVALEQLSKNTSAVKRIDYEGIEGDDTEMVEVSGMEMEVETGKSAVDRREPLWYKEA